MKKIIYIFILLACFSFNSFAQESKSQSDLKVRKYFILGGSLNLKNSKLELLGGVAGVDRAAWLLQLSDASLLVVSFEWGVRPGLKAQTFEATKISSGGKFVKVPVELEHTSYKDSKGNLLPALIGSVGDKNVELQSKTTWTHVKDPELLKTLKKFGLDLVVIKLE